MRAPAAIARPGHAPAPANRARMSHPSCRTPFAYLLFSRALTSHSSSMAPFVYVLFSRTLSAKLALVVVLCLCAGQRTSAATVGCALGRYRNATGSCVPCPKGFFCDGASQPTPCPAGQTSMNVLSVNGVSTQILACNRCPVGYYCPGGSAAVECKGHANSSLPGATSVADCYTLDCPPGTYAQTHECVPCLSSAVWVCLGGSKTSPTLCPINTHPNGQKTACVDGCLPGERRSKTGCIWCETGYECDGYTQGVPCPPGQSSLFAVLVNGVYTTVVNCTTCPSGSYCPGASPATACPGPSPKFYSAPGATKLSDCVDCPPGTYVKDNQCQPCRPCYYCPECTVCAANQRPWCPGGSYSPNLCGSDFAPNADASACVRVSCIRGFYLVNQTCVGCPQDYYCAGGGESVKPVLCPPNTFSPPQADQCYDNPCTAGYYSNLYETGSHVIKCSPCPAGTTSPRQAFSCTPCPANHFCPGATAAVPCSEHSPTTPLSDPGTSDASFCRAKPYCSSTSGTCDCLHNFGTVGATSSPGTPALPTKFCSCSSSVYTVGIYDLALPIAGSTSPYPKCPEASAGASSSPCTAPSSAGLTRDECCSTCKSSNSAVPRGSPLPCAYWLHYVPPAGSNDTNCPSSGASLDSCGWCIMFPSGVPPPSAPSLTCPSTAPFSLEPSHVAGMLVSLGKGCPGGKNDPHFVGARGTQFDFNGEPGKSFCLITDTRFQVNMRMHGYYDTRTVGASVLKGGRAVRTWIKELGVLWVHRGAATWDLTEHKLRIVARRSKSSKRGKGFLGKVELDGVPLPRLGVGKRIAKKGGFVLKFLGYEKQGGGLFDVDVYQLKILGFLEAEIRVRVAHPLLQTKDDALAHINVVFVAVNASGQTHGILGQTFREGREQAERALRFSVLNRVLGHEIAADAEEGQGFLDGSVGDYRTSCTLCPNCQVSAYRAAPLQPVFQHK